MTVAWWELLLAALPLPFAKKTLCEMRLARGGVPHGPRSSKFLAARVEIASQWRSTHKAVHSNHVILIIPRELHMSGRVKSDSYHRKPQAELVSVVLPYHFTVWFGVHV